MVRVRPAGWVPALWLCLALAAVLPAAPSREIGRPFVANFTPSDYRGHNQMWSTVQGPDGLLYFGNRGRVFEFDGVTWRKLDVPATFVRHLAFAADGRLYLGSTDELGALVRRPDGTMHYESLLGALPQAAKPLGPVTSTLAVGDAVYFSSPARVLRWQRGEFKLWSFPDSPQLHLSQVAGTVWLQRPGLGLFALRGEEFAAVSTAPPFVGREPTVLLAGEAGGVLALTRDGEFHRVDAGGTVTSWVTEAAPALRAQRWHYGLRLADGSLAIGSQRGGVLLLSADGRIVQRADEDNGLESQIVLGLFADREGSVWINTDGGTSRVEFSWPYSLYDRLNGTGRDFFIQFQRHADRLYAVNSMGLLHLRPGDPTRGVSARFEPVPTIAESGWSLASHRSGLLVGTRHHLYLLADGATGPVPLLRTNDPVTVLRAARDDPDLLFVGRGLGLNVLRYADGAWRDLGALPGFTADVRSIAEGAPGELWLGTTTRGIVRLVRPPGRDDWLAATVTTYLETNGLPKPQGWTMVHATAAGPVFTPRTGAYRYDRAADTFRPEPSLCPDGNIAATVGTLAAAPDGKLWLQGEIREGDATLRLHVLAPAADGRYTWRAEPRKLQEMIGWGGARTVWWDRNAAGEEALWLSGAGATVRLDLAARTPALPPYAALVRSVAFPGEAPGPAPGPDARPRRVPYAREPIVFTFAATRFSTGAAHEFQTRLIGYEDQWSPWSVKTETSFTNLIGGPFAFEVRARDPEGEISAPARYVFSVAPPWHRSDAAWSLYLLLAVGGVAGFVRWRLRHAARERDRLERLVVQRTAELKEAKDSADAANRAKSVFLANMSHELRTPLNGVIGYAQVLMKDRDLTPRNRERVQIVRTSGEHLLRMINEVLDFSKIEAGRMELAPTPFHLPQLLRDIAAAASVRLEQKQLEFVFDAAPGLPDLVVGDPIKLRQVLDNLLGNAVKFTARGSVRLEIRPADAAEETVRFAVSDTGVGISPAARARLFQPFQQAVDGRPPEPGTGLGLAIGRRLVELMGGTLDVTSTPGVGSVFSFTIRLPVLAADAHAEAGRAGTITGYRGRRRRILVVDDVAINRRVLVELLAPLGFEITEAASGAEALAVSPGVAPDLVLLDLRMPGIDGFELARRLRERAGAAAPKLIAMSASVLSFSRDDAFAAGCDDFLAKPFREEDLLARIGMALQVEWTGEVAAPETPAPEPAALATRLPAATLAELLAHARRGAIGPLRRRLADLRGDPLADTLDTLAKNFRMENIRTLLETHAAAGRSAP